MKTGQTASIKQWLSLLMASKLLKFQLILFIPSPTSFFHKQDVTKLFKAFSFTPLIREDLQYILIMHSQCLCSYSCFDELHSLHLNVLAFEERKCVPDRLILLRWTAIGWWVYKNIGNDIFTSMPIEIELINSAYDWSYENAFWSWHKNL